MTEESNISLTTPTAGVSIRQEDWVPIPGATLTPAAPPASIYDTSASGKTFGEEERVYWNQPDGLIIKKSEFGGILPKNWEHAKDKLCGRFFFPDGSSLVSNSALN